MLKSALVLSGLLLATNACAAPPENADPKMREWFEELRQPSTGAPWARTEEPQAASAPALMRMWNWRRFMSFAKA